jgi:hypothetical protein
MQRQPEKVLPKLEPLADRFHLLKNLRERIKDLMDRRYSCLPEVEEKEADAIPAKVLLIRGSPVHEIAESHSQAAHQPAENSSQPEAEKRYRTIPPCPYRRPARMRYDEGLKQARRDKRYARYEDVRTLSMQGVGIREIARRLKGPIN